MQQDGIESYLIEVIQTKLDLELDGLPVEAGSAFEDLGVDSLSLVELAILIKNAFGVDVDDEELAAEGTVAAAAALVRARLVTPDVQGRLRELA